MRRCCVESPAQFVRLTFMVVGVLMGRIRSPDEIAIAALFLASDDSNYFIGIELFVDGGMAQI